ncbi:MFS transporter [Saccharopolyspora sp. K220]|uniref:MFS transporter n=1 Tax=Saccharopolyspora soli TaxID=2926618 RepID=UPI001F569D4A|nr:MFS transporter [Saccharopolyspora soli]MCI2421552.1 MFS transporter [Saccharopolyspora soli]
MAYVHLSGARRRARQKALTPLRLRTFRQYFIGQALSTFGDSLVPLTIAFAALDVGGPGALGLVLAANRVPIAMLVLFGGVLGDRWDRRWVMVGADVLRCGTQMTTGLLLISGFAEVWHLVVLQGLSGVGTAVFVPSASGLVPSLVPMESLQKAHAFLGLAANTNKVLSISLAGALVATVGPGIALLVDAVTFAASAVSLLLLRLPSTARGSGRRSLWGDVRDGVRFVIRTPWLRVLLGYSAMLQALVIGPHMVAGPLLANEVFGGAGAWAAIGVVQAVGSIVGGMVAIRWWPRRPLRTVFGVGLLMTPYLLFFAWGAPLWLVAASAVAVGMQGALFMAMQSTILQQRVPASARSRVAAWSQLGSLVLLPTSLAVAGPVVSEIGGETVLLVGVGWLVLSTGLVLSSSSIRSLDVKEASPVEPGEASAA